MQWQPNTLVMWDNRSAQHHAIRDYAGYARYAERYPLLAGDPSTLRKIVIELVIWQKFYSF